MLVGNNTESITTFLAQSIICDNEVLACEECEDCRRIKEGIYPDLIVYDGNESSIKKDDVEYIQSEFKKSSFEGKERIYILKNIENSSPSAMNSLLKFLEEPQEGVFAILTTKNVNKVLPTIQSRCQVIHLLPESKTSIQLSLMNENVDEEDASVLAQLFHSKDACMEMKDSEVYEDTKIYALNFVEDLYQNPGNLLINTQVTLIKKYKNDKSVTRLFLNMLVLALRDLFHVKHSIPLTFTKHKELFAALPEDQKILKRI
jgi:DNA polymerase-3 subunit delta'